MPRLQILALDAALMGAVLCAACGSPANAIRPMIPSDIDAANAAMRSAPVVLVVRIAAMQMTGDKRNVAKPPGIGGPMAPAIPLHLARVSADVLLTVQGQARTTVEFYSWIWASGSHGGGRLFHPDPGGIRVVFLREEGGYLHTVGDYPAHDIELSPRRLPALLSAWNSGQGSGAQPLERLAALLLRTELEGLSESKLRDGLRDDGVRVNHQWAAVRFDLERIVGPLFVVTLLDDVCLHSTNASARFAACFVTAESFPGRCEAYQLSRKAAANGFGDDILTDMFKSCQIGDRSLANEFFSCAPTRWGPSRWSVAPQHRRETLRVYATAMDAEIRRAACEVAAVTPEARDIPECTGLGEGRADPAPGQRKER